MTANTLDSIRASLEPDIRQMTDRIARQLHTANPMLQTIVGNCLKTRGKLIRPIVVLLMARMLDRVTDAVISGAGAIELLHNASLVHDDVVDQSRERRGQPTINAVWNNHVAVLVGDYFVSSALRMSIDTHSMKVVGIMSTLGTSLSLGELDQIYNAAHHTFSEDAYFQVITGKTASLFKACAHTAADSLGIDDERSAALVRFAELLGLCFQMRDDVFDYFTDPAVGKPTGNDLREGKITLPLIYALDRGRGTAEGDAMNALARKESLSDAEIEMLMAYAVSNGGIDYTYRRMNDLRRQGDECLAIFPPSETKTQLLTLFDFIISRNH